MGASYGTILVGTDGSATSFRAVDRAAELARDTGAMLVLLTAYRPLSQREQEDARLQLGDEAYKVSGSSPAEGVLRDASDRARNQGATAIEVVAAEGDPVDALIDEAIKRDVGLLVVGNRGLNSLAGRLLGSVPANITHKANCDVLIVHTTGKGSLSA